MEAMETAARCLLGRHDFAAFTHPSLKGRRPTVRLVSGARLVRRGRLVRFDMEANAFLPRQVRRSVGALVQVGLGRLTPAELRHLVESASPGAASFVAPATNGTACGGTPRESSPTSVAWK